MPLSEVLDNDTRVEYAHSVDTELCYILQRDFGHKAVVPVNKYLQGEGLGLLVEVARNVAAAFI
jgi:hypothetical protein